MHSKNWYAEVDKKGHYCCGILSGMLIMLHFLPYIISSVLLDIVLSCFCVVVLLLFFNTVMSRFK